jgi:hypothetical protein
MSESNNPYKAASNLKKEINRRSSGVAYDATEFMETRNSEWVDSAAIDKCQKCAKLFSLTNRKHHCRECGKVFCNSCSNFKLVINGNLKRVCISFLFQNHILLA